MKKSPVPRVRKKKPAGFRPKPQQETLFANGSGGALQAEEALQRGIVRLSRSIAPTLIPMHPPNELARDYLTIERQLQMGMLKDAPDLFIFGPNRFVAMCELKTPGNYARPGQRAVLRMFESMGFATGVIKSKDDLRNFYHAHGIKTREDIEEEQWGFAYD